MILTDIGLRENLVATGLVSLVGSPFRNPAPAAEASNAARSAAKALENGEEQTGGGAVELQNSARRSGTLGCPKQDHKRCLKKKAN